MNENKQEEFYIDPDDSLENNIRRIFKEYEERRQQIEKESNDRLREFMKTWNIGQSSYVIKP